jgi:ABC-type uncharacterized transport system auxiliary subunit
MRYYVIEIPAIVKDGDMTENKSQFSTLSHNAEIRSFKLPATYDQIKIVVRTNSNEINYYYYHQWAELPSDQIKNFIADKMNRVKIFENTTVEHIYTQPDYLITSDISAIERVDDETGSSAHIEMSLHLIDFLSKKKILTHSFNRFESINRTDPMNTFVSEISKILDEETDHFIQKIFNTVKSSNKQ